MLQKLRKKIAQSLLEYIFLVTLILFGFLTFQKYITRGFVGRWQSTGESFGFGRQYDPNATVECAYDFQYTNQWYGVACYEANNCTRACKTVYGTPAACQACILSCPEPRCVASSTGSPPPPQPPPSSGCGATTYAAGSCGSVNVAAGNLGDPYSASCPGSCVGSITGSCTTTGWLIADTCAPPPPPPPPPVQCPQTPLPSSNCNNVILGPVTAPLSNIVGTCSGTDCTGTFVADCDASGNWVNIQDNCYQPVPPPPPPPPPPCLPQDAMCGAGSCCSGLTCMGAIPPYNAICCPSGQGTCTSTPAPFCCWSDADCGVGLCEWF